ncbi:MULTISPECIES: hypothetical protein [Streptacidiphilus]|uniref:Lipoprotein n=1 Tax=Streptacidiphilus cavernicola TaxID=3342716 RepID=A0ABV6UY85_9ACTN|nr:hypothetical protein [Streptacidiphilus jeojiense]
MGPRRISLIAIALLLCSGCAAQPRSTAPSPTATATATGVDPVEECADSVAYWVRYLLTPGSDMGLDYQEMGLSGGENNIVQSLLPAARSTAQHQGLPAAQAYALAQARPRCRAYLVALAASPGSAPGWPK